MPTKKIFLSFVIALILCSCSSGNGGESIETVTPTPSETPFPPTPTITSIPTQNITQTIEAEETIQVAAQMTEDAIPSDTPEPQGFGWDAYQAISFEEFLEEHDEELSFYNAGVTFFSEKYKVKAIYLFEKRTILADDKEKIVGVARIMWGASQTEEINKVFQEELLFNIEGNQYWLPVHALLVDDYEELAVNQEIEVYIIVMAVIHEVDSYSWVIINTAFVECDIAECE